MAGAIFFQYDVIVNFFWRFRISLITFSYWSKFQGNIGTGSGVKKIFIYQDWPGIRKSEVYPPVLPNILRLEQIRDTKFGTNVSNKKLLNATKYYGYSSYRLTVP